VIGNRDHGRRIELLVSQLTSRAGQSDGQLLEPAEAPVGLRLAIELRLRPFGRGRVGRPDRG
jgi:hypothetical protein